MSWMQAMLDRKAEREQWQPTTPLGRAIAKGEPMPEHDGETFDVWTCSNVTEAINYLVYLGAEMHDFDGGLDGTILGSLVDEAQTRIIDHVNADYEAYGPPERKG